MPTTKKKTIYHIGFELLEGGGYIATSASGKRFACLDIDNGIAEINAQLSVEIKKRKKTKITITIE